MMTLCNNKNKTLCPELQTYLSCFGGLQNSLDSVSPPNPVSTSPAIPSILPALRLSSSTMDLGYLSKLSFRKQQESPGLMPLADSTPFY